MDSHNITAAKLTKEAGITNGLITQWKSHKQKPSMKNLMKIANYFDVSMAYFLDQKNKPSSEEESLSDIDAEVLKRFRLLDGNGQKLALAQLDAMLSVQGEDSNK